MTSCNAVSTPAALTIALFVSSCATTSAQTMVLSSQHRPSPSMESIIAATQVLGYPVQLVGSSLIVTVQRTPLCRVSFLANGWSLEARVEVIQRDLKASEREALTLWALSTAQTIYQRASTAEQTGDSAGAVARQSPTVPAPPVTATHTAQFAEDWLERRQGFHWEIMAAAPAHLGLPITYGISRLTFMLRPEFYYGWGPSGASVAFIGFSAGARLHLFRRFSLDVNATSGFVFPRPLSWTMGFGVTPLHFYIGSAEQHSLFFEMKLVFVLNNPMYRTLVAWPSVGYAFQF